VGSEGYFLNQDYYKELNQNLYKQKKGVFFYRDGKKKLGKILAEFSKIFWRMGSLVIRTILFRHDAN